VIRSISKVVRGSKRFRVWIVLCLLPLASCSAAPRSETPFDGERAYADVESVVGIGARVPGTPGSVKAQEHIKAGLSAAGLEIREFPFKALTPMGTIQMNTIVGVVQGTSDDVILLSNHYDTKYFRDIPFVGANDGGSTTGWMLEMARTLGGSREGLTVWLCFFDGEEAFKEWTDTDSLYGSRDMVATLRESGELKKLKTILNVDMIGDCALGVFQDPGAPRWLHDIVWGIASEQGYGDKFLPWGNRIDDDHLPFRHAGIEALNMIDFRYGGEKPVHDRTWHTANDNLDMVCAESLKVVGDVVYHVLPKIDAHFGVSKVE
jgi:glutaminyl-peptide cyclotransferase